MVGDRDVASVGAGALVLHVVLKVRVRAACCGGSGSHRRQDASELYGPDEERAQTRDQRADRAAPPPSPRRLGSLLAAAIQFTSGNGVECRALRLHWGFLLRTWPSVRVEGCGGACAPGKWSIPMTSAVIGLSR